MLCMTSFISDDLTKYQISYVFIAIFAVVVAGDLIYITNTIWTRAAWAWRMEKNRERYVKYTEELFEK